jgi:threonyl-tRNA synthetase
MTIEHRRHTLAHLLNQAVQQLYPHALPTIGPAVDNGFYFDFDFSGGSAPTDKDLKEIQTAMRKNLKKWTKWTREEVSAEHAREVFAGNAYKLELRKESRLLSTPVVGLWTCVVVGTASILRQK